MCQVDDALNGAAVREAQQSTSELQEPGADLGEGSACLDDTPVIFRAGSADCGLCEGRVSLYAKGMVVAKRCLVSGSCELDWVQNYPQNYVDENGNPKVGALPCGAEVRCKAVIGLERAEDGTVLNISVVRGVCQVTDNGRRWQQVRDYAIEHEPKNWPKADLPASDALIVNEVRVKDPDDPSAGIANHSER